MPYNEAQRKATARYKAKVGRVQIAFDLNQQQRDTWPAYAAQKGLTLNNMVRDCVRRCMALDGFDPAKEDIDGD